MNRFNAKLLVICFLTMASPLGAQQQDSGTEPPSTSGPWNLKTKTLGGMQFWTDMHYQGGWRIQQNSETDHFRLLNPHKVRYAWGAKSHCLAELERLAQSKKVKPNEGRVVILLHGLVASHNKMSRLAKHFSRAGEFQVINFEYSSSRKEIGESAQALHSVITSLGDGVTEINFVGHSLGGLVIRHYLHDQTNRATGQQGDPRIARTVMIAPPNQGSQFARILKNNAMFKAVTGKSGRQLAKGWDALEPNLATPHHEFGIIAGAQAEDQDFQNYLLEGRDDLIVRLSETRLEGASDTLVRPFMHSTIVFNNDAIVAAERFLKNGYFVAPDKRAPAESPQDRVNHE